MKLLGYFSVHNHCHFVKALHILFFNHIMPSARGGHKVKTAKTAQTEPTVSTSVSKPTRWRTGLLKPALLSRNTSEPKLAGVVHDQVLPVLGPSRPKTATIQERSTVIPKSIEIASPPDASIRDTDPELYVTPDVTPMPAEVIDNQTSATSVPYETNDITPIESESDAQRTSFQGSLMQSERQEDIPELTLDTFDDLDIEETQSSASSSHSKDRLSIYSSDSASIYSSASSIYSSGASIYSVEEDVPSAFDSRAPGKLQNSQRTLPRTVAVRRQEAHDAAIRERSTLAKKAAMFKNSRLSPDIPSFSTTLPTWSMVCRAAQASDDCYDSGASTRLGTYTQANTSKNIKAMIVNDQLIDGTRVVIVAIRGTQFQCLSDWSVNKDADPVSPVDFLDNEENACHSGFLQVAKAMISQVSKQLREHPASSEMPSLLFTGHSAGGAVAAMLYSHMLSSSVTSELTTIANLFSSINCITFGAPPLSLTPLPKRYHFSGIFLSFANEGDPVTRLSNGAYVKSLVKLLTSSTPSNAIIAPPVKVVRGSRGTRVIRTTVPAAPQTPWEELPLWSTPPAPLSNAGVVILLRDRENGNGVASHVTTEELSDVIFADLAQHTMGMYMRRVKDVAFAAMMGIDD